MRFLTRSAFGVLILAITLTGWVQYARTVRGSTLVERNKEYVQAARVTGVAPLRIMVRHVLPKHSRVVVEGVNVIKKHQRARQQGQQSQIVEREAPIHISNVMLVDPNDDQPTRVTFRRREDGTVVRIGKRTGEDIE